LSNNSIETNEDQELNGGSETVNEIVSVCGDCGRFYNECKPQGVEKKDSVGNCAMFVLARKGYERITKEQTKKRKAQTKSIKINISDLFAVKVGKYVEVDCQIVGQQDQKALPRIIMVSCPYCEKSGKVDVFKDKEAIKDLIFKQKRIDDIGRDYLSKYTCSRGGKRDTHYAQCEIVSQMDFAILHVRDILRNIEKFDDSVHKDRRIYLINQRIPKGKLVKIKGHVVIEPDTRNITIIVDTIESLEGEFSKFSITEEDKETFPKYFNDFEIVAKQISPDTVGEKRRIAKKALTLLLHSPNTIPDINGKLIRGGLRVIFIGDTKCDKSGMGGDISGIETDSYRFGEFFLGETGGRTGLTYTIDTDNKIIIWGLIPLNDKGLVVIDGMASIASNEIKQFREILEMQKVIVRRSQSGEAWARTRLLGCMNPGKPTVKPMNEYLYPCMAIPDTFIFQEPPDITRWDIFICFAIEDVSEFEITARKPIERPIPDDIYIRHVYWVWSREPEHIVYEGEAKEQIIKKATEIVRDYSISSLPIVHNGFRDVLTALSVAYACVEHSTNDTHEEIIIKSSHVIEAHEFYKNEVLDCLGLQEYKLYKEGELSITDNDIVQISQELEGIEYDILDAIKFGAMSSPDLADQFGVSIPTIKRHYDPLKKHKLIRAIPGKGIELTAKGTKFLKGVLKKDSIIVSKSDTKSIEDYEIVSQNDTMIPIKTVPPIKLSQEEQIKYMRELIKRHDHGEGADEEIIIDLAKGKIDYPETMIRHLKEEGIIYESRQGRLKTA